jgi:outer membrane protein assembly factor BamB
MLRRGALVLAGILFAASFGAAGSNWPQFRGPGASGVTDENGLPDSWNTSQNIIWKIDIPGNGWSSPVVWEDKIFVTSVLRDESAKPPQKGLYFGGNQLKPPTDVHRWMVYAIDWKTGKVLWEKQAYKGPPPSTRHAKNTYASETPVTEGERLYVYFGNLGLFCYDLGGKELWSRKWDSYPTTFGWGTASSPVLYRDRLYVQNDNQKHSTLKALDTKTGQEIWVVDRDELGNWATPFVWENDRRTEIVTCGSKKVRSYGPDGKLLWELRGMSSIDIPTPVAQFGMLYVSSGYILDKKRPVFAIRPGAAGDISLKEDETSNAFVVWSQKQAGPYNPSPVVYGDFLYVLYDQGFLSCYDARTGKEVYKRERLGGAKAFTASPWAYGGKIFCLSEDGDTFVVAAGPKFKLLGKNKLDEMCMATPALARGSLIIRTFGHLYRIGQDRAASR